MRPFHVISALLLFAGVGCVVTVDNCTFAGYNAVHVSGDFHSLIGCHRDIQRHFYPTHYERPRSLLLYHLYTDRNRKSDCRQSEVRHFLPIL